MSICVVTGAGGLVGAESVRKFAKLGYDVIGIDNNSREAFFGPDGSVIGTIDVLKREIPHFKNISIDIRDEKSIDDFFSCYKSNIAVVIHCAAQPSHDWAYNNIYTDFSVNAFGTLNVLNAVNKHSPEAFFIHLSTNKVYGDFPNHLDYIEEPLRYSPVQDSLQTNGFDESTPIDGVLHSFFGVSKASADLLAQEFGRNSGLKTVVVRGGCLTGPGHKGVEAHGFFSHLVKSCVHNHNYKIIGYLGKQVRDNIHSSDLVNMFVEIVNAKTINKGAVYNVGGGAFANCSILEAIEMIRGWGFNVRINYDSNTRTGDHKWWVSNTNKFKNDYPKWQQEYSIERTLKEMVDFEMRT